MLEEYRFLELAADTILREYRFHNSYQYDERQMLNGNEKNLLVYYYL